jgi:hypothetical protein
MSTEHKALDQRVRRRLAARQRQRAVGLIEEVRQRLGERGAQLVAREPRRLLKLLVVERDRLAHRLAVRAEHYLRIIWPRLTEVISHVPDDDARLLEHFTSHRLFERFPDVNEARQTAEPTSRPSSLSSKQRSIARVHQRDRNWIRPRKMRCITVKNKQNQSVSSNSM